MIRAGSLYYALFISFVITLILGLILMYAHYNNRFLEMQHMRYQADLNAESGITLALHEQVENIPDDNTVHDLYGTGDLIDQVAISCRDWGMYNIIKSTAQWNGYTCRKIALAGADPASGESIALYVADNNRYLSFGGRTKVTGTCYLPKQGVRKAYIEGQAYTGGELIHGAMMTSTSELPAPDESVMATNRYYFEYGYRQEDTVMIYGSNEPDSIERSFNDRTLVIYSNGMINLGKICLKGNIRIVSGQSINIDEKADLENVILYAPVIRFEEGFQGVLQAFAQDSIIAAQNCRFHYPSALTILNNQMNNIYMEISENSLVTGTVFIHQEKQAMKAPFLKIGDNSVIHGQVYNTGVVELKGTIIGSLYCDGFSLRTPSSVYENHLLNAVIDGNAVSEYYSGSLLIPGYKYRKTIQWLN